MKIKSNKINYSPFFHGNQVFNKCEIKENKFEWLTIIETEGNGIIQKIYVDSFIKKVSIEELAQMVVANGEESVSFMENSEKKFIVNYTIQTNSNILDNSIFVITKLISNILYAEVAKYQKLIIYDHLKKDVCSYTNDLNNFIKDSNTHVLAVWRYQYDTLEIIGNEIMKRECSKKNLFIEIIEIIGDENK